MCTWSPPTAQSLLRDSPTPPLLATLKHICVSSCRMLQVSLVLSALQAGNKGTQACITAESAVSGIIADLDTTIMFASAGTLNPENEESFADHRYSDLAARGAGTLRNKELPAPQKELIVLKIIPADEWLPWSTDDATRD